MDKRLTIRAEHPNNWDDCSVTFSNIKLKNNLFRLLRDASFNRTRSVYVLKKGPEPPNPSWRLGKNSWGAWTNLSISEWIILCDKLVLLGFFKKISKGKQIQFKITKSTSSIISFLIKEFYTFGYYDNRFIEDKCLNKYFNLIENSKYIRMEI